MAMVEEKKHVIFRLLHAFYTDYASISAWVCNQCKSAEMHTHNVLNILNMNF